jgi:two-component system, OmpR family, response regulator
LRFGDGKVQLFGMAPARPRGSAPATGSLPEAGLRGRLEQFGLATVLTFLDLERRSGELLVLANDQVGRLWLRQGRVIRVRVEGSRRAGKAAIYDLLALNRGHFSFTQVKLEGLADEIGAPTALLLMEAARRADEAAASSGP